MKNTNTTLDQNLLVLIDFSRSSFKALKYAISLAKTMEARIILLYVATPRDLAISNNPKVVLRATEAAAKEKEAQFISIVEMIESERIPTEYINTVGDVFTQIRHYSEKYNPSLTIIGKRDYGKTQLGEVANFLVFQNTQNVLIVGNDHEFNKATSISVECNEEMLNDYSSKLLFWLNSKTEEPLKLFVNKRNRQSEHIDFLENWHGMADVPHKICTKNDHSLSLAERIISHISKEKVDLVCIGRKPTNTFFSKLFKKANTTSEIINNARIPTLIMGSTS